MGRFKAFCGDTGTSNGCSLPALSPMPTSSAQPPTWRRRSLRSTAATASKATPSTWTARATRTSSDRIALLCEGGAWFFGIWGLALIDSSRWSFNIIFHHLYTSLEFIFLDLSTQKTLFFYFFSHEYCQKGRQKTVFLHHLLYTWIFRKAALKDHPWINQPHCMALTKGMIPVASCGLNLKIKKMLFCYNLAKREVVIF